MSDDYFKNLTDLTSEISRRTGQLDEMVRALLNLNLSIQDKDKLKKMITHMATFNKPQQPKPAAKPSAGASVAKPASTEQQGDSIYDLFNSPAMMSVIKEHYGKKKKK